MRSNPRLTKDVHFPAGVQLEQNSGSHSLEHDLTALRIIHPRIVDAEMLTRYKIAPKSRKYGLKALCSELLKLEIRANKKAVHDCMEDVMATREVVLFCLRKKREFGRWAGKKRREEEERKKEVERLRKEKMAKKEAQKVDEKEKVTQDKTDSKDNMLKKDRAVKQENILQTNTIAAKEKAITKSWVDTTQSEWYRKRILEMGLRDRAAKKIKKDVEDEDPEAGLDDDDDSYWDDDDSEDEDYEDEVHRVSVWGRQLIEISETQQPSPPLAPKRLA
ncbi:putative Small RNA degrading nuclease 3 [Glarea lozoyensis 74030]|uniref:Putative Small RNA degrading nuclease 3 n=1 Tax=Glarea lozoyensis (strain ATCC 74030 / MF5533) TaxID=1104152 RepID=H0EJ45_GLAL7|nr:putative Small RNA degrading nuclease 3 [Glarea lozoyensis 74030]